MLVDIFCRTARFALASLFCRNFSTQIGVRAATTALLTRSSASLIAVPPVIQPPQENPITIDATAPIAIPCSRRVRDSPRRIEGICMAFAFSIRGVCAARASAAAAERNAIGVLLCPPTAPNAATWRETETSVRPRFMGSSRTSHYLPLYAHMGSGDIKHNRDEKLNAGWTPAHAMSKPSSDLIDSAVESCIP
jgi:hypothetical protein